VQSTSKPKENSLIKNEINALATRKKISIINRKQKLLLYKAVLKTHFDLWNSAMGESLQLQYRNLPEL
jgi:hypothetical protein